MITILHQKGGTTMNHIASRMARLGIMSVLAGVCAVGLMSGRAWAETLRGATTNGNAQTALAVCPAGIPASLDLSSAAGAQCLVSFSTPGAARVVIRFNAECSIAGAATNWLNLDIWVDPAGAGAPFLAPPSGSDNALCSGNGIAAQNDGWVSAVTQAITSVPAGVHTVRVSVNPVPAGIPWRIDDLSLTIETQP